MIATLARLLGDAVPVWVNLRLLFDGHLTGSLDGHEGWLIEQRGLLLLGEAPVEQHTWLHAREGTWLALLSLLQRKVVSRRYLLGKCCRTDLSGHFESPIITTVPARSPRRDTDVGDGITASLEAFASCRCGKR